MKMRDRLTMSDLKKIEKFSKFDLTNQKTMLN